MNKLSIITIILLLAFSCSRKTVPVITPIKDSTKQSSTIIERITETKLVPDSASIKALVKCDSTGQAYLSVINQLQGERVNQSINQTASGKDLSIEVKAKDRAKETQKESTRVDTVIKYLEKPVPYKVPVEVNVLTGWQWFQIWLGRILLLIYVILIVWNQIRNTGFKGLLNRAKSIFN